MYRGGSIQKNNLVCPTLLIFFFRMYGYTGTHLIFFSIYGSDILIFLYLNPLPPYICRGIVDSADFWYFSSRAGTQAQKCPMGVNGLQKACFMDVYTNLIFLNVWAHPSNFFFSMYGSDILIFF